MSIKKKEQLGMNPSTAQQRLVKDLLWDFVVKTGQGSCCKCGKPMSRETFSIEHVIPWLDTHDPVGLFFDIHNISYSHLSCNLSDARRFKSECGTTAKYRAGCRCSDCKFANTERQKTDNYRSGRRNRYKEKISDAD